MKISRRFTKPGTDVFDSVRYEKRTSRISNPDGSVVFEMNDAEIPAQWSQLATDIMVSKYFRKAGVPQADEAGNPLRDAQGNAVTGPEKSARQVINRLAGCWRYWGEKHGYFDSAEDAQAFYDELAYMLLHQMCAPNSPQWFNTGLNFAYGITGPAQGHFYCDPKTGEMLKSRDAYSHPQPHACQPFHAAVSTPRGKLAIGKIVEQNLLGLEVYDGTDRGVGTTRVVAVKANGKKMVYRVVLDDGAVVEATGDHLVYVINSSGLGGRWVRVDSIDPGMKLVHVVFSQTRELDVAVRSRATAASVAEQSRSDPHFGPFSEHAPLIPTEALPTLREAKVTRVKAVGVQNVYDIQTESGRYLSNDIVVHNCFIQSVTDDLVNPNGIMDLWTREARLFKYGSGTGTNFSKIRGENEPLSGGGKSSGLMSFLKIGDRAAGAIKSGGTTRRAAKMVCLDLDHPDVESFVNWKVREELKVAAMVEGLRILPREQQEQARKLGLKLDYDFNGESYMTVSGQNSNNSVRIPNRFFKAVEEDGDWKLTWRSNGKVAKTVKARALWEQIAFAAWRCADPGVQYDDTINQWHTCPKSGRINASNPCVTGDTRVLTPGGIWRRIDQMIHLPARVITNLHAQQVHVTEGAFPTGTREVFELKTVGGYSVKLTADHKVWTRSRGWIEAQHLQADDEVRLPSKPACVTEIGQPQDPRFFELLGMLVSETNGDVNCLRLDTCLNDADAVEEYSRYVTNHWGERAYDDDYANDAMLGRTDDRESNGDTLTATLTNRRLISRLRAFVRSDVTHAAPRDAAAHGRAAHAAAPERRLSDEAFTAGLAAQKHLLRALFSADAKITQGTLELQSESRGFLEDVQLILLGFGVQTAIHTDAGTRGRGDAETSSTLHSALCTLHSSDSLSPQSSVLSPENVLSPDSNDGGAVVSRGMPDRPAHSFGPPNGGDASPRHGLRIDPGSLRSFGKHVGLLPGRKLQQLAAAISFAIARPEEAGNFDRVSSFTSLGSRQVFDLTEPRTSSFVANGLTVHNCSEYMFLDDTACNLASLNVLTFFDPEARRFDVEGYKHGCRIWTIVLEISVLMASFPSESIAKLSYHYRTLGLGYANLGAMLMQAGIPYDSEKGRAICGALTAILTGESYATSAELARELGAFPGYEANRNEMLRVIRNHRRAAYDVAHNPPARKSVGGYESLDIEPVGIVATEFADNDPMAPKSLLAAARECWDRALTLGEQHGYRNAQTTVIAPTGCLVGRSLVATDRGLMRLDHLGDVNGSRWQEVSFSVLTDQGEQNATKFFVNGAEQTRRITTGSGYAIEGTLKHRIKVIDTETGEWVWKHFADIQVNDVVPLAMGQMVGQPRPVSLPPLGELYWTTDYTTKVPRTMTPELAEFIGYFMGDGSLHAKGLRLCVSDPDPDVIERLRFLAKTLFNLDVVERACEGYVEVSVHSVALTIWWEACGFTKLQPSPEHSGKGYLPRIPAAVLASNDPVVYGAFLRGLYEADGTVTNGVPCWSTASPEFSDEVKALLLAIGLPTSTKHDISGWGQGTLCVLRLRNASYMAAFRAKVGFIGTRKLGLLRAAPEGEQAARYDYIHLPPELIEELVPVGDPLSNAVTLSRKRHRGAITRRSAEALLKQTGDVRIAHALQFYYDAVEANEDAGEQMTYDLSVPANVTYVANGFVSHNTIGLLMDCDTTGVEPDFALVKFKKLAGGGYFKIANQSLRPSLVNLGYEPEQIHAIIQYVMGTLTLHDAPHLEYHRLKSLGFTEAELEKIEASLPGTFEISFAFSPWTMGPEVMKRFEIPDSEWQAPNFNLLRRLGFTRQQIDEANDIICGRGTVEGAPDLKDEHLPVFDCANKCGKVGKRFIPVEGHIRMMAAAQPFISGAISKTINLPNEATLEDIKNSYTLSWKLGLKANALYRDGSKLSQPLNVKSDEDLDKKTDEEDEESVAAAREEVALDMARAAKSIAAISNLASAAPGIKSDNLAAVPHTIEKIVERIVERPLRRRLPDTRRAITHKFDVAGHEGYITVGLYEDGQPGEVFIRIAKEGSTIGGLMDTIATLVSVSLQYGVPVESLVRKFEHVRFEPSGMTRNPEIPIAKSLTDYIFRWMAMEFVPGYRAMHAPKREKKPVPSSPALPPAAAPSPVPAPDDESSSHMTSSLPPTEAAPLSPQSSVPSPKKGNGHGPRIIPDTAKSFDYTGEDAAKSPPAHTPAGGLRLAIVADPLSQQGSELQADAPACDVCGSITVRSGTCYKCLNCGNSMGCS